jgi:superfamily II DNA/RNA helicase
LIAQANNSSGKTGALVIGSLMRVDLAIKQTQVIVIGHSREIVNENVEVFERVSRFAPEYKICNLA